MSNEHLSPELVFSTVTSRLTSGNAIPVERAHITADEWAVVKNHITDMLYQLVQEERKSESQAAKIAEVERENGRLLLVAERIAELEAKESNLGQQSLRWRDLYHSAEADLKTLRASVPPTDHKPDMWAVLDEDGLPPPCDLYGTPYRKHGVTGLAFCPSVETVGSRGMHPNCTDPCGVCDSRDAARYRWLRDQNHSLESQHGDGRSCMHSVGGVRELKSGGELDASVDAHIRASLQLETGDSHG